MNSSETRTFDKTDNYKLALDASYISLSFCVILTNVDQVLFESLINVNNSLK